LDAAVLPQNEQKETTHFCINKMHQKKRRIQMNSGINNSGMNNSGINNGLKYQQDAPKETTDSGIG
jgi:hypothetical protein